MLESLVASLIIAFVKLLTGAQAFARGFRPHAAQRIYFANHASHGDFVLLWATLPPYLRRKARPVAGADYWNKSALRRYIAGRVFRAVLIDRERKEDSPDPVQQMVDALSSGCSLILFPEGTRNTTDQILLPFKSGLFHLAGRYPRAELVPVWINNLGRVMPKGEPLPIPLLCTVTFGATLPRIDGEDKAAFLQRARDALLALRPESPDDDTPSDEASNNAASSDPASSDAATPSAAAKDTD
ncbi:MAG: 1-acyl-sn-glycerol-3-phosphate acyltransferase [Xanthomonadaceae bacterium]|nr:1-acyl-sn-glycerol-3-phosphate acyltransferase [Xanthomonadaceae bacterium]